MKNDLENIINGQEWTKVCSVCNYVIIKDEPLIPITKQEQRMYKDKLTHGYCDPCYNKLLIEEGLE